MKNVGDGTSPRPGAHREQQLGHPRPEDQSDGGVPAGGHGHVGAVPVGEAFEHGRPHRRELLHDAPAGQHGRGHGVPHHHPAHRHGAAFQLTNPRGIARRALEITGLLTSLTTISRI